MIDNTINDMLYAYIGGIIKELDGTLIEINAMLEHIHFYAYMPKNHFCLKIYGNYAWK